MIRPIINSAENDALSLSAAYIGSNQSSTAEAAPPSTAVINTAIDLFALLLCSQDSNGALKAVSGLVDAARGNGACFLAIHSLVGSHVIIGDKSSIASRTSGAGNVGRRMAVTINGIWAILIALRHVMTRGGAARVAKEVFGGAQVGSILGEFLKVCGDAELLTL